MGKIKLVVFLLLVVLVLPGCDFLFFGDPNDLPPTPAEDYSFLPDFKPGESVYENEKPATVSPAPAPASVPVTAPEPISRDPIKGDPLDICCYDSKAKVGEQYYIPFDGSGCITGDQQVPLDKNCGNPLLY